MGNPGSHRYPPPPSPAELGLAGPPTGRRSGEALPKMKKFRFQLLARWIAANFPPCAVADVGGGKGLLAYLLERAGFQAEVVDPVAQALPPRYRDLDTGRRAKPAGATVARRPVAFTPAMGERYDLLVALHAHGTNVAVLDAAARAGTSCVLLPCCVVDEPSAPEPGQNWFMWLVEHARDLGLAPEFFQLNFRGQNLGFAVRGARPAASAPPGQHHDLKALAVDGDVQRRLQVER